MCQTKCDGVRDLEASVFGQAELLLMNLGEVIALLEVDEDVPQRVLDKLYKVDHRLRVLKATVAPYAADLAEPPRGRAPSTPDSAGIFE